MPSRSCSPSLWSMLSMLSRPCFWGRPALPTPHCWRHYSQLKLRMYRLSYTKTLWWAESYLKRQRSKSVINTLSRSMLRQIAQIPQILHTMYKWKHRMNMSNDTYKITLQRTTKRSKSRWMRRKLCAWLHTLWTNFHSASSKTKTRNQISICETCFTKRLVMMRICRAAILISSRTTAFWSWWKAQEWVLKAKSRRSIILRASPWRQ